MHLRFLSFFKYTLLAVVVASLVVISGCDDDDDGPTIHQGTVMDLIKTAQFQEGGSVGSDVALDSLVKYLEYHGLDALLAGSGPYTLFAPSNDAFKTLIGTPGFPADIRKINPAIVKGVLSYHIVSGENLESAITSGASFSTLFTGTVNNPDDKINVNSDGTLLTGSTDPAIQIVDADNRALNGVVHVTNKVLIPQSVGASLTPILGTLAGSVFLGADFTYLVQMITNADDGVGAQDQIRTLLATPAATDPSSNVRRTFFAPPNAFFEAAAAQTGVTVEQLIASFGTGQASAARAVLLNHFVTTNAAERTIYTVDDITGSGDVQFTNGMQLTSNAGVTLTVVFAPQSQTNPYGVVITSPSNPASQAPIAVKDITHANGSVLHAVLGFLKPQ